MNDLVAELRKHQERDATFGLLFEALHSFTDRTIDEFFGDTPGLPHPVLTIEEDRANKFGLYMPSDGHLLPNRINLNPRRIRGGLHAAEILAHELVHHWQQFVGRPCKRNYHGEEFHQRMRFFGLKTQGRSGDHFGEMDDDPTWPDWLSANADLQLAAFILPGADYEPPRKLVKHSCPGCKATFRSRKRLSVVCVDCEERYVS